MAREQLFNSRQRPGDSFGYQLSVVDERHFLLDGGTGRLRPEKGTS
jgi:hypothetical protein